MKIKNYILTGLTSIVLASCADLNLQPLNEAATGNWFTDESQVEMSLNALYRHKYWPMFKDDLSRTTSVMALDEATDDWTNRTTLTIFTNGSLSSSNSTFVKDTWANSYEAIKNCNVIVNGIVALKDKLSTEKYEQYVADARFVRACQYSRLIEYFGDVVYYTADLDLDSAYTVFRTPKETILERIYEDFDYASEHLPVSYAATETKRATKGAALGMKARVALFFGDYETARDAAKDCINLSEYELYPDFGELFLSKTKNSVETVFGIPRSTAYDTNLTGGAVTAYLSRNITSPSCTASPSWDLLCSFLCTDGKTIDESALYDPHNPFKNRDPRCASTIVAFNTRYFDFNYTCHPDSAKCWNYATGSSVTNKDSKAGDTYASYNGLILRKGIDADWSDDLKAENDKLILRYADVLLMYAEAKIELNDIDQTVLDAMNQVRARAYKVDYLSGSYPKITETDQTKLRRILRIERRMELAFEGQRYNDILRWKIAHKVMNYPNYGIPSSLASCKTYVRSNYWFFPGTPTIDENGCPVFSTMPNVSQCRVLSQRVFNYSDTKNNYLWPIPSDDISINPNLTQNLGY